MKVELDDNELKLIKEALTNNAVKYYYDVTAMVVVDENWAEETKKKADNMAKLLIRLNEIKEDY